MGCAGQKWFGLCPQFESSHYCSKGLQFQRCQRRGGRAGASVQAQKCRACKNQLLGPRLMSGMQPLSKLGTCYPVFLYTDVGVQGRDRNGGFANLRGPVA